MKILDKHGLIWEYNIPYQQYNISNREYNITDIDDDWEQIRAYFPEDVAKEAGKIFDEEDCYLIRNPTVNFLVVRIRKEGEIDYVEYKVYGESVPHYYTYKLKSDEILD